MAHQRATPALAIKFKFRTVWGVVGYSVLQKYSDYVGSEATRITMRAMGQKARLHVLHKIWVHEED